MASSTFATKSLLSGIILIYLVISVILSFLLFFSKIMKIRDFPVSRLRHRLPYWIKLFICGYFLSFTINFTTDTGFVDFYGSRGELVENFLSLNPQNLSPSAVLSKGAWHEDNVLWGNKDQGISSLKNRIWFVTVTEFSLVQAALLTKTGQALFPIRDDVVWIIVKLEQDIEKINEDISNQSTQLLLTTVRRFGIPFVVIKSNGILVAELTDTQQAHLYFNFNDHVAGMQNGLLWIMTHVQHGVVMMGNEDFTFDYHLFEEVAKTQKVSVWPVGLDHFEFYYNYRFMFAPFVGDNEEIYGFIRGGDVELKCMQILQGGFAINIQYLRKLDKKNLWKFTYNDYYYETVGIPLSDIEPLANLSTKIYVWKTNTYRHDQHRPKPFGITEERKNTNIEILFKKALNYKYDDYVYTMR